MKRNPLLLIARLGQSIWLDSIDHDLIHSGGLRRQIEQNGVRGATVNLTVLERDVDGGGGYDEAIRSLARQGRSVREIYERIVVEDIKHAADTLRCVYDRTGGRDGFVSLDVSPHHAHDTRATVQEARRLWASVSRPNCLIKVPATRQGLRAIRQLIGEGINVHATLLFEPARYRELAEAYIAGLELRAARKQPLDGVASVAGFFLGRIDLRVDQKLGQLRPASAAKSTQARGLHGLAAIATAKLAYHVYQQIFSSPRFRVLAGLQARTQRLLWACTSAKNPRYSDVKYVDALIAPETVNSLTPETLEAFRDHGNPAPHLAADVDGAHQVLERLGRLGIAPERVARQLEREGVERLINTFDQLMAALKARRAAALGAGKRKGFRRES